MDSLAMIERHALKFAGLAVVQQQRLMKKLANASRAHALSQQKNADSAEARHYDWQRRVRLSRESRAINLVRAFLKGLPYHKVEVSNNFHTLSPSKVVNDYMPFSFSLQMAEFNGRFNDWLAGKEPVVEEVVEEVAA